MTNNTTILLHIGKITKRHGIRGELAAVFYTDSYETLSKYSKFYNQNGKDLKLSFHSKPNYQTSEDKNINSIKMIIRVYNIQDTNQIEPFINKDIYVDKNEIKLSEDEFLISELIGLEVYNYINREEKLGTIVDFHDFGGGLILEINSDLKEFKQHNMLMFNKETFPETSLQERKIYLNMEYLPINELD